jgi:uncharacterized lipoprotein YmbA
MKNLCRFTILIIGFLTSIGCITPQPFTQQQYQLEVSKPAAVKHQSSKVLEINNVAIVPQFASLGLIYRTSELNYLVDYYNVFFAPPEQQINQVMINYLRAKNIFSYVANDVGQLKIDYILSPQVTALYADYRNTKQPLAVIAIDCTLFSVADKTTNKPLLHKVYTGAVPLKAKNSESLIIAWNQGLQKILWVLSMDLNYFLR